MTTTTSPVDGELAELLTFRDAPLTKRPWKVGGESGEFWIAQEDYSDVPMDLTHVAHIVRCVNSHDALVRALTNLVRLCAPLSRGPALAEAHAALRDTAEVTP